MARAFDSVFSYLIRNTGPVLQSDLAVACLTFYNQIFIKLQVVDQSVSAMNAASGDHNLYCTSGQKNRAKSSTS